MAATARWKHPRDMGAPQVEAFLTMLATERKMPSSTHNQALSALLFLYREVLDSELPWLNEISRPPETWGSGAGLATLAPSLPLANPRVSGRFSHNDRTRFLPLFIKNRQRRALPALSRTFLMTFQSPFRLLLI